MKRNPKRHAGRMRGLWACAAALGGVLMAAAGCCRKWSTEPGPNSFTVRVVPTSGGAVTVDPADSVFTENAAVKISAAADSGYLFVGWYGDTQSVANPLAVSVSRSMTIEARFAKKPQGMVRIAARDSVFSMGSTAALASPDIESPVQQVRFSSDFYMDPFEVTQEEYRDLIGANPASGKGYADAGDSFAVFDVTWYEAALFCNERSKRDGYDTVYSYTARCSTQQTCPYVLENCTIHYDRFGYRLPTEAEWEYACRGGTTTDYFWGASAGIATAYAWYFDNSQNVSHPVGRKLPNAYGLYDMCGNVGEWVNDWLDTYADSLLCDPVGPTHMPLEQFEASWERPVRGGSYDLGFSYLRSSARRLGPYETPAKIAMKEIGFRTVLGTFFPSGSTGHQRDTSADSLQLQRVAEKSALLSFLGTSKVKLVFVKQAGNTRTLYCIDYTQADLTPFELEDSLGCYGPTVSPNGAYVAYSSQGEGRTAQSTVTVRPLERSSTGRLTTPAGVSAYLPRWWARPSTSDTFLVYTDAASANSSPQWREEKTYRQQVSGLSFAGSAEVLWGIGSYHGGLSSDGRFLATGYTCARVVDLQLADTTLLYFRSPYNGQDRDAQTCNVSISPGAENTDEMLLLDFGYSKTSTLVGKPYGLHAIIFRCNSRLLSRDQVVSWYEKPVGFSSWNDVEYTNHPDFAVARAQTDTARADERIFLVDLADSSYLEIVRGSALADPWLWIDPAELAETPDQYADFAKYDLPIQTNGQEILTKKLKLFWKYRQKWDCIFFGSSEVYHGINPSCMPHVSCLSMATRASDLVTSAVLGLQYALANLPGLKAICVSLDPGSIDRNFVSDPPYLTGLYDSKGYEFDAQNNFWAGGLPAEVSAKIAAFDSSSWTEFDTLGFPVKRYTGSWMTPLFDQGDFAIDDSVVQFALGTLRALADSAASRGIHVLAVNFPQHPDYRNSDFVGRLGPSWATYAQIVAWIGSLASENSYFHFYDAHANGQHDYQDSEALDCNHLGYTGAAKLSARVDSVLQVILGL